MTDFTLFENALKEYELKTTNDTTINNSSLCKHVNINEENSIIYCLDCGIEMEKSIYQDKEWRYYGQADNKRLSDPNRVHLRKIEDKNIFKDVENMGFSDKIVYIANQIYLQVTNGQIFRGNSRKSVIFACIFHSFKKNDHINILNI